jgi:anthranilate synthase component 1
MDTGHLTETIPDYTEIEKLCAEEEFPLVIPVYAVLDDTFPKPADAFALLRNGEGFILESLEGNEKIARYSILGFDIRTRIRITDTTEISGDRSFAGSQENESSRDPIEAARAAIKNPRFPDTGIPIFPGGFAGYFSYDIVYSLYPGRFSKRTEKTGFPLAEFLLPGDYIVYDHYESQVYIASLLQAGNPADIKSGYRNAVGRIGKMIDALGAGDAAAGEETGEKKPGRCEYRSPTGRQDYEEMVRSARDYIYSGDIFQAVVSRRFECGFDGDPYTVYRSLRRINPSPYMYFIDFGDRQVIGASPEMLVRCRKGTVSTVPIAGTRKRGATTEEDAALAEELLADGKECSEHIMLVDLARNDIGRVSKYGTVKVPQFMGVEKFSHVQHIVSTVEGELDDGLDGFDALRSCFPAGTVSGAPKVRAMEIIDELETETRGLYAGAVGYICPDGDLDFAIAIRTVLAEGGRLTLQAGAGIVADSVPENEFFETESKAAGMIKSIDAAGGIAR